MKSHSKEKARASKALNLRLKKRGVGCRRKSLWERTTSLYTPTSLNPYMPSGVSERQRQRCDSQESPSMGAIVALLVPAVQQ
jgi:hypothetical protein